MTELVADRCTSEATPHPLIEAHPARHATIGDLEIRRALPLRERRLVGPWCFLDRYGPLSFTSGKPMDLGPHPHIGLQTVSWLFQGLVLHRDSLGSRQLIRPGELNLMTAGGGIAHSEESAAGRPPLLHGLQLWIALPEAERHNEPRFAHHADLPVVRDGAANVTVARSDAGPGRMPGHSPGPFGPGDLTGRGSAGLPPGPAGWGWRRLPAAH